MGTWNLGSVATEVILNVPNFPTAITGAPLERIADRQREYVQNYTGQSIGSNSIDIKYQEAILQLSIAKVTKDMLGNAGGGFRIGDLSVDETNSLTNLTKSSSESAKDELKVLGRGFTYYKANG